MDFQKGDRVELNEDCIGEYRTWYLAGLPDPYPSADHYFRPGAKGTVVKVDWTVHIDFDDGTYDNPIPEWVDLLYRPINDPSRYERTLFG